jgi:hypothetical protein
MKLTIQFNDKPPVVVDGVWRLVMENGDESFEVIPQMVDKGEPRMLVRVNDVASQMVIIPHGSNSIRFGAKK